MPLAGMVLNRTHPPLADLSAQRAEAAAERLNGSAPLTAAVLRVHAERLTVHANEQHMRARFVRAHPGLPSVAVPARPTDVHDLAALRAIGEQLAAG